jgi:iron complex outermembrane receptor protein
VNGVINIITKSSADTPGGLAKANYGSDQSHGGAIRYGGELTDNTSYRAFAKYDNYDSTQDFWGSDLADDWKMARIGGRIDSIRDKDSFTVIAEYHDTQLGSSYTFFDPAPPYFTQANADEEASGGFVLGRWRRQLNNDGELSVQAYIDAADRHYFAFAEDSVTYDVDMQYRLPEFSRHDIIVGAGYRLFSYDFLSTAFISVEPPSGDDGLLSAFIQDDMAFLDDRLSVIVGLKFEKNNRLNSETELLPSLRANWQIADKHSVWGSVSKSARTPSYADYTVNVQGFGPGIPPGDPLNPAPLPATFRFSGSPNAVNEELIAYELGYRGQLRDDLSLDVALFVNDYDDLQDSILVNTTCAPSGDLVPLCLFVPGQTNIVANTEATSSGSVDSVGGELALEWSPSDKLQFNAIYSLVDVDITADTASPNGSTRYGQYSKHQFSLRADIVMSASTSMNLWASYTDAIESIDIHDFWNLMARYAWRITHNTEVSIVGRNLLDSEHPEFVSELSDITPTEIERSVTAEVRYTF